MPDLVWVVLLLLVFFGLWQFIGRATGADLGSPFREQWFAFQARRWRAKSNAPSVLKRTYWTAAEFKRDHARLVSVGYKVVDQTSPERGPQEFVLSSRYRRRLPAFYVTYQLTVAA